METRGLKTLFAGGVSSTIPLVTLQATLYLVGPILGHDILDSEEFFETMTWVVNVGMMAGSLVAVLYIDKSATCYYYLTFISAMGCHSLVFLTIRPNDEFLWLVLGVSMGTFSTICQYKVILRAAIYEKKDYALGLIPLAIAGITFGNLLGIGIQYYVLKRFPLSNTVDEKMFLIYVWIFTITVMILSVKFYTDIAVEIDHGGISMNNDRSISIFNHYDSFKSGFKSFKLVINPLFLYLTCLTLESFFIPGSVNIITDSFHHIKFPWNRYTLLFTYYTGIFCGSIFSHLKSRTIDCGKHCLNPYKYINWPVFWFMLLCIRLPMGMLYIVTAHYQDRIQNFEEMVMCLSVLGTFISGIIAGTITSLALTGLFFGVIESDKTKGAVIFNKARVVLSFAIYFGNYIKFIVSWVSRKYLALFAYVVRHSGNGHIWPTANISNAWSKFKWWVYGTIVFMHFDIKLFFNIFMGLFRELFNLNLPDA